MKFKAKTIFEFEVPDKILDKCLDNHDKRMTVRMYAEDYAYTTLAFVFEPDIYELFPDPPEAEDEL